MEFVEPKTAKEFECGICLDIFDQPVQIGCKEGHIFCKKCLTELREQTPNHSRIRCPLCRQKCKVTKSFNRVPFIDRQIKNLMVKCPNHRITPQKASHFNINIKSNNNTNNKNDNEEEEEQLTPVPLRRSKRIREKMNETSAAAGHKRKFENDDSDMTDIQIVNKKRKMNNDIYAHELCDWIGALSEYKNHFRVNCPLQLIECRFCVGSMLRKEKEFHDLSCLSFPVKCKQCNKEYPRGIMGRHIKEFCPMTKIKCDQCGDEIKRTDKRKHYKRFCSETVIKCDFDRFGCDAECKRKDMEQHNAEFTHYHLVKVKNSHFRLEMRLNRLESRMNSLQRQMAPTSSSDDSDVRNYYNWNP